MKKNVKKLLTAIITAGLLTVLETPAKPVYNLYPSESNYKVPQEEIKVQKQEAKPEKLQRIDYQQQEQKLKQQQMPQAQNKPKQQVQNKPKQQTQQKPQQKPQIQKQQKPQVQKQQKAQPEKLQQTRYQYQLQPQQELQTQQIQQQTRQQIQNPQKQQQIIKKQFQPQETQETIFTRPKVAPEALQEVKQEAIQDATDTTTIEKTFPQPQFNPSDRQKKYWDISLNQRIVDACELLKDGPADFSYQSIHGQNKTKQPIKISFVNFANSKDHKAEDAYGAFSGRKYVIRINSKYLNAPPEALAAIIAREALVSKEKTDSDKEEAMNLQMAVWAQMLDKKPALSKSKDTLAILQNKLLASGNPLEYNTFLSEAQAPKKKPTDVKKEQTRAFGKGAPTQTAFNYDKQTEDKQFENEVLSFDGQELKKKYKKISNEDRIMEALELLKNSVGKFSHDAILGNNLTNKPIAIKFKNLGEIKPEYSTFDALGWRQAGRLNIFINEKHADAPAAALAAILAHEALHQDEFDSLNEETYAWTMEASVWTQLCDKNPNLNEMAHPLVTRENLLKKLLEKGDYTNKYIKKSVFSNPSYSSLPARSPGFEDDI